jgi:hypothetical protein
LIWVTSLFITPTPQILFDTWISERFEFGFLGALAEAWGWTALLTKLHHDRLTLPDSLILGGPIQ